jgi:hypothetical protein
VANFFTVCMVWEKWTKMEQSSQSVLCLKNRVFGLTL